MRTFKTGWFIKAARKAELIDRSLRAAIHEVDLVQADDLGGGVFEKRLDRNMHRGILLTKVDHDWLYQSLVAKRDRANIDDGPLRAFRLLAEEFSGATEADIARLVSAGHITEICDG